MLLLITMFYPRLHSLHQDFLKQCMMVNVADSHPGLLHRSWKKLHRKPALETSNIIYYVMFSQTEHTHFVLH